MKVGDYVRTNDDGIQRIVKVTENNCFYRTCTAGFDYHTSLDDEDIIKSSPNIIDLIEVGDIIKGIGNMIFSVIDIDYNDKIISGVDFWCEEKDIKSIVTKEQFKSMTKTQLIQFI